MNIETFMEKLPEIYSSADREVIMRAYQRAEEAHHGQKRASDEPYISHSLAVAEILVEKFVPPPYIIVAGLLHDTVEDTHVTLDNIRSDFGELVAKLVDGVTKLTDLPRVSRGEQQEKEQLKDQEQRQKAKRRGIPDPDTEARLMTRKRRYDLQSETLRKTLLAMAEQPEVVMVKLADRLHNMRTLQYLPEQKRRRVAQETLDIFAPLANRLGIWQMKWELEDLAFLYIYPDKYKEIAEGLAKRRQVREKEMEIITRQVEQLMNALGLEAKVSGRPKHIFSIYRKISRKGVPVDELSDIRGVRIIVQSQQDCYAALGAIHTHWHPIPGEFDDYIAAPKPNNYRSLHTSIIYDDGKPVEFQIRTPEMHMEAEQGIAAHWRYKEGSAPDVKLDEMIKSLRTLMDWRQDVQDAREFVDGMRSDVFPDRVYVFTPRGDAIDLPAGSTPIDFAYHVHTEIGHRCRGAKVNSKLVPLDYTLKTGDQVSILTAKRGRPSRDWLNSDLGLVKTQRAKSKIRRWFKVQDREQNIAQGKHLLERELRRIGMVDKNIEELTNLLGYHTTDDLLFAVGCGDLPPSKIINQLTLPEQEEEIDFKLDTFPIETPPPPPSETVSIIGLTGMLVNIAKCCKPAPGDPIMGYITRGRGVTVHRVDCPNMLNIRDRERVLQISWGEAQSTYPVPVRIKAYDRKGLMRDISTLIDNEGINITFVDVNVQRNVAIFDLVLEIKNVKELSRVLNRISSIPNVFEALRLRPG
jgi:GTP pyrophosphokinase